MITRKLYSCRSCLTMTSIHVVFGKINQPISNKFLPAACGSKARTLDAASLNDTFWVSAKSTSSSNCFSTAGLQALKLGATACSMAATACHWAASNDSLPALKDRNWLKLDCIAQLTTLLDFWFPVHALMFPVWGCFPLKGAFVLVQTSRVQNGVKLPIGD